MPDGSGYGRVSAGYNPSHSRQQRLGEQPCYKSATAEKKPETSNRTAAVALYLIAFHCLLATVT